MSSIAKEVDADQLREHEKTRATANVILIFATMLSGGLSLHFLNGRVLLASLILAGLMLVIARIDFAQLRIPDVFSLPAIPLGLLASGSVVQSGLTSMVDVWHAIGMVVGGLGLWAVRILYLKLRNRHGLGLGDVKLAAAAGAWVGLDALPEVLLLASAVAIVGLAIARASFGRAVTATYAIPFGAALAPAIWTVWFVGTLNAPN